MAAPFDTEQLEVLGEPIPVVDGLVHSVNTGWSPWDTGASQYSVSRQGLLAFAPGGVSPSPRQQIVRIEPQGEEESIAVDPKFFCSIRFSPDETQILNSDLYPPYGVWVFDVKRGFNEPQVSEGRTAHAIWGPGPEEFTFESSSEGGQIYTKALGSDLGEFEILSPEIKDGLPSSWSSDRRWLAFVRWSAETGYDIFFLDREGGEIKAFPNTSAQEMYPEFSPDGHWLAYTSDTSGGDEVYVRSFPDLGRPVPISTDGGIEPCWSQDGTKIFFSREESSKLLAYYVVDVDLRRDGLYPSSPIQIHVGPHDWAKPVRLYDVGSGGELLLNRQDPEIQERILSAMAPTSIEVVQNWFEELKRLVPTE